MPSKKKKYNARFPAGRIKKIMQSDEEIGKVAQAVPVIISRTLELFVESLLTKTLKITNSRSAKTLSTSHMKQCIMSEQRFDFLRDLVKNIPDISMAEEASSNNEDEAQSSPGENYPDSDTPYDLSMPSTSTQASRSSSLNGDHQWNMSQNGSGMRERLQLCLKRGIDNKYQCVSSSVNSSNVISSLIAPEDSVVSTRNSEYRLPRLVRSDSTPVSLSQLQQTREKFKHQPQSVPLNNNTTCSPPPKQLKRDYLATPLNKTDISAPIASFDFCNTPILKINYSNLPVTNSTAPQSTHAEIDSSHQISPSFNFTAEPIINIDLSNMISNTSTVSTPNNPPVATISIGAISVGPKPDADPTLRKSTDSILSMAVPFTQSNTAKSAAASVASPNLFFELDEDYDNI